MNDRDILVALLIGGAAVILGLADFGAKLSDPAEGTITFVTVATMGWAGYKLNR